MVITTLADAIALLASNPHPDTIVTMIHPNPERCDRVWCLECLESDVQNEQHIVEFLSGGWEFHPFINDKTYWEDCDSCLNNINN